MKQLTDLETLKIKLSPGAKMPSYATDGSNGLDLVAISETLVLEATGPLVVYETGVSLELPEGYCGLVLPRSSITTKTSLMLGNSVGLIDNDYVGTIKFQFRNINLQAGTKYKVGDKIGQLLIIPSPKFQLVQVDELKVTTRGSNAFGSTGA